MNVHKDFDLGFLTDQQLYQFFCKNKTKMSMISKPVMLLHHLKDNEIIDEAHEIGYDPELSKESIYMVMDFIGKQGEKHVRKFWNCVNQEDIWGWYREIYELIQTLKNEPELSPGLSCVVAVENETSERSERRQSMEKPSTSFTGKNKTYCNKNTGSQISEETLYRALEFIESCGPSQVLKFWNCFNQEHILKLYPQLSLNLPFKERHDKRKSESICESDKVGPSSQCTEKTTKHVRRGSHSAPVGFPHVSGSATGKKSGARDSRHERDRKKKRAEMHCDSTEAGSSSQKTASNKKTPEPERGAQMKLWDMPKYKKLVPVTCGMKKASLDRTALFNRKRECIRMKGKMITPFEFEKMGGKGAHKAWKNSIECQGYSLSTLMKMGILKIPDCSGKKFTLHK